MTDAPQPPRLDIQGMHPTGRDKDPRARARHRSLSRKGGLPTIEVDGKVLVGFQAGRLEKAIRHGGEKPDTAQALSAAAP